jgi:hypothetical protein
MHYNNYSKMIKKVLGLAATLGKVEYRIGENIVGLYQLLPAKAGSMFHACKAD